MNDLMMPPVDADLHVILAKSDGETLVDHTWQVLSRLADQRRIRPTLAVTAESPRLWHWLFWAAFLHDFGKIADGVQAVLGGESRRWGYRHEALSLVFVDWLFPENHPDRLPVLAAIACHHRDLDEIKKYAQNSMTDKHDLAIALVQQANPEHCARLYRWLTGFAGQWAAALGFADDIELPAFPATVEDALAKVTPDTLHHMIHELAHYGNALNFGEDSGAVITAALLRGLIITSDHAGSAHSQPFDAAPLARENVTRTLNPDSTLFPHQHEADHAPRGSALLISPTSSGKTEAALLWLARQQVHDGNAAPRIFYLLPYQASINATHQRLQAVFPQERVGLQHSRMMQVLYARMMAEEDDVTAATAYAQQQKALTRLLHFPVTVMSPYQLLKVPYQLKGFEALLTHFYGGHFILDEIHAYDPARLARIIAVLRFLHQACAARFFIMTATLPPQVRAALHDAIPDLHVITADAATFQRFQRHRVHVLPGDLLAPETLSKIVTDAEHKSVLICCNTVRRALEVHQAVEAALQERYGAACPVVVVHSRFNSRDRWQKEQQIMAYTGVHSKASQRTVVIATQVVEVSLNINLHTLYTEAAPLEALLQRFGRVNRGNGAGAPAADVYIVEEQSDAAAYIYDTALVEAAKACLKAVDGQLIDESLVGEWLEKVYTGEALARWEKTYKENRLEFERGVMRYFKPLTTSERDLEKDFYSAFDGVDVLPTQHLEIYERLLQEGKYLEASGWLVPIRWYDFKRLERERRAWHESQGRFSLYCVDAPYSEDGGLDLYAKPHAALNTRKTDIDDFDVPLEAD